MTTSRFAAPHRVYTQLPTEAQIKAIPLSKNAEFSLSEKETRQLRYHLYKINHDGIRRYRTMREGPAGAQVLLVWRIK
jgi:hypothetical protein